MAFLSLTPLALVLADAAEPELSGIRPPSLERRAHIGGETRRLQGHLALLAEFAAMRKTTAVCAVLACSETAQEMLPASYMTALERSERGP